MALNKIGAIIKVGGKLVRVIGHRTCPVCRDRDPYRAQCPTCNGEGKVEKIGDR